MASSNAYGPPSGFAIRRWGSCSATEVTCDQPWDLWHDCCPEGTHCSSDNTCCPRTADCSPFIQQDPHCANNVTWDLYWDDEYFCCQNTAYGFIQGGLVYNGTSTEGIGCTNVLPDGDLRTAIPPVARGNESEAAQSSMSSSTPTPSPTPSSTPMPSEESSSSTNSGAIAGGVVGGVAGLALILALAWYLIRRRQKAAQSSLLASTSDSAPGHDTKEHAGFFQAELDNNAYRAELYGNHDGLLHELPVEGGR